MPSSKESKQQMTLIPLIQIEKNKVNKAKHEINIGKQKVACQVQMNTIDLHKNTHASKVSMETSTEEMVKN